MLSEADNSGLKPDKLASELKLHPFVAKKGLIQARHFTLEQLKQYLNRLVSLDFFNKTGQSQSKAELTLLLLNL